MNVDELKAFPRELTSLYRLTNPILELVKLLCKVLSLDHVVEQEAVIIRRQLLRNLKVKEFAGEAQFSDPFHSFVIPAVVCPYCNFTANLDICSDPELQESVGQNWRE